MFFVTTAANMPTGAGYFEVHTEDYTSARAACFNSPLGEQWCFIYETLDDVHYLDRIKLGEIYPVVELQTDVANIIER